MTVKKRGRRRMEPTIVAEEAARYGFTAPEALPPAERYISPNEAGRILNVTGEAVKQWIYHRRLPATKLSNGYWKVKVSDLEDFIKARQDLSHRRILVIDNQGSSLNEMIAAIEKLGHEPVIAHNVSDAMLKAVDLLPSLFIVNLSLNPTECWKLVDRIRKTRNIRRLPILILADGDLKESESETALELGIQGFLKRPIKSATLVEEVEKILSRIM